MKKDVDETETVIPVPFNMKNENGHPPPSQSADGRAWFSVNVKQLAIIIL